MEPRSETSCHCCARASPIEPFSCSVLSFPAYIGSYSLLPRTPEATHATSGHSETGPLYRSGVFLFHRGLPFHQSCFNLIAPSFILCPQYVQIGGPRWNKKTPLHKTSLQASGDLFSFGVLDTTSPNNGHVRKYWHTWVTVTH